MIHILGNEDELIQLFSNLLENSFKYGHENSEINVSIQKTKNRKRKKRIKNTKKISRHQHKIKA